MKNLKTFEEFLLETSEAFQYHHKNGLDITNSIFRLGSDAYVSLFEETKKYWDEGNIILKGKSAWMAKNLMVGKKGYHDGREVELDIPKRGGEGKKFYVFHSDGEKDKEGRLKAYKIEWGDSSLAIKNADEGAAASFWARQQCDLKKKMDPSTAGFWACYAPSLFTKQLGLDSDQPW